MGLLDDAIREHLDLKRRRGADPTEVERAEREALGPVRRAPHGPDEPELEFAQDAEHDYEPDYTDSDDAPAAPTGHGSEDLEDDLDWHESAASEPHAPVADSTQLEPELELSPPPPEPAAPSPPARDERSHAVTPPPAPAEPHPAHEGRYDDAGEETMEYDVEEALGSDSKSDDVLEETPEFLQDTPDHDRLWFEQKPPRDFDFDG